ncbi:Glucosyl-3-phosphoglycerate synthase [compost metagenome]
MNTMRRSHAAEGRHRGYGTGGVGTRRTGRKRKAPKAAALHAPVISPGTDERTKLESGTMKAASPAQSKGARWRPPARRGTLSVIVSAQNEEATLPAVLREAERLLPEELIVVLNGCSDESYLRARQTAMAMVVHYPDAAGHDVGRAIGARLSRGDILLFLDGDIAIPAPALAPFVTAVDEGADVALNDLNPLLPSFEHTDPVTRCKLFLNLAVGREDLGASSMTAVPHALSRRALSIIGPKTLMVPPKAQAAAVLNGLIVKNASSVNVIGRNRVRRSNTGAGNAVEQMILGDHAEALAEILARGGVRKFREAGGPGFRSRLAAWRNQP